MDNYSSCVSTKNKDKMEGLLRSQINNDHYLPVSVKPDICSPQPAIDKFDDTITLIHDASWPEMIAINDYLDTNVSTDYQSVKDVIHIITPEMYCFKIYLISAYISIGIKPLRYHMSGIKLQFTGDTDVIYW